MYLSAVSLVQTGAVHLVTVVHHSGGHLAHLVDDVTMSPSGSGIPGGALMQKLINWGGQYGLWVSLLAIIIGLAPSAINLLFKAAGA